MKAFLTSCAVGRHAEKVGNSVSKLRFASTTNFGFGLLNRFYSGWNRSSPLSHAATRADRAPRGSSLREAAPVLVALCAVGCAADTMHGYIGQDIRAVMLAYGPPASEVDLGNGVRAFQWSRTSVDTTPLSAMTTTARDKKGRKTTETQFVGGTQTVTNCLFTFLAAWNPDRGSYIVTSFRQPSLECAFNGLS